MIKEFYSRKQYIEERERLKNAKEAVAKFEERLSTEIREQEKLEIAKEKNFERKKLLGKVYSKNVI